MAGACRIDDEAVRIVDGDDRRIAQRPDGETLERFRIGDRIGAMNDKLFHQGLRLGGGHSDAEADLNRGRVSRDNFAPSSDCPTSTSGIAASGAAAPILRRSRSVGHVGR